MPFLMRYPDCCQLIAHQHPGSRFKHYQEPVLVVPEIIRSEENDVDPIVRHVIEWPDPPPPLSAQSVGDANVLRDVTTASAPGTVQVHLVGYSNRNKQVQRMDAY